MSIIKVSIRGLHSPLRAFFLACTLSGQFSLKGPLNGKTTRTLCLAGKTWYKIQGFMAYLGFARAERAKWNFVIGCVHDFCQLQSLCWVDLWLLQSRDGKRQFNEDLSRRLLKHFHLLGTSALVRYIAGLIIERPLQRQGYLHLLYLQKSNHRQTFAVWYIHE